MSKPEADPSSGTSLGDALRLPKRHPACRRREAQSGSCAERENLAGDAKGKDAMGRAAKTMAPSSLQRINGAPHATAERFEQIPRNFRTRCNTDRRDRDGPVELAGRRYRAWRRALAVEETRGR